MLAWNRMLVIGAVPFLCAFKPFGDRTFYVEPEPLVGDDRAADTLVPDTLPAARAMMADAGPDSLHSVWREDTISAKTAAAPNASPAVDSAPPVYDLPSMVVRPRPRPRRELPYAQSAMRITPAEIKQTAGTAEDISRYIGTMPAAVSSIGAGYDNTLFIRGGRPDEVVFLVDGIELENINHFSKANGSGGPIGFISSDNVKSLQFHAGAMPVSFPPRISSVVDIDLKNGSLYDSKLALGCKLTGGMLSAEGPLQSGKSSFALSGRYVDFTALRSYVEDAGIPRVGDLFGKLFLAGNDALDLSATGILSWNHYRFFYPSVERGDDSSAHANETNEIERILQGGGGVKLRLIRDDAVHEARLAVSFRDGARADSLSSLDDPFFAGRYARNPVRAEHDSRIRYQMHASSSIPIAPGHTLSLGARAEVNRYDFSERDESDYEGTCVVCGETGPDTIATRQNPQRKSAAFYGMEPGAFLEYAASSKRFRWSAGIRADYFDLLDDAALSPRVSITFAPRVAGSFSVAGGLYHQFPTEIPTLAFSVQPYNAPPDSLAASSRALLRQALPRRAWQASLGYDRFFWRVHELRIETYYKWYDREYGFAVADAQHYFERDRNGVLVLRSQDGRRRACGIEASVANRDGRRFFYSISGALFDIKNRYADGSWQNDWTDVEYTYSFSGGGRFMGAHALSLSLQGSGGRPYCPKKIVTDCIDRKFAVYDASIPYFSRRLEGLVSASMRYSFLHRGSRVQTEGFIEVLNVLDYTPTLEYKWNGDRFVEMKPFKITPILGAKVNW